MTATTPGLVCAHHHLYSALARGMPPPPRTPTDFQEILELIWWRLDTALDLEMLRWSAMLGALEALEQGTTAIVDHHESPERDRGQPVGHRRGLRGGRRAGRVRLRRHRPARRRRGAARSRGEPPLPGRGWPRAGRDPRRLHLLGRDPGGRRRPRRRPRRRRPRPRLRGPQDHAAPDRLRPLAREDWLLAHAVHLPEDPGCPARSPTTRARTSTTGSATRGPPASPTGWCSGPTASARRCSRSSSSPTCATAPTT
jgi:hypothetical protein